jgi:hypothetical protein
MVVEGILPCCERGPYDNHILQKGAGAHLPRLFGVAGEVEQSFLPGYIALEPPVCVVAQSILWFASS